MVRVIGVELEEFPEELCGLAGQDACTMVDELLVGGLMRGSWVRFNVPCLHEKERGEVGIHDRLVRGEGVGGVCGDGLFVFIASLALPCLYPV